MGSRLVLLLAALVWLVVAPSTFGQRQTFTFWELSFNPIGPEYRDGRWNPFHVAAIREATNWLIDRKHIVENLCPRDGRVPWIFPVSPFYLENLGLTEVHAALEAKYAYDPQRARAVIAGEMEKLGATLSGGRWFYKGKLVVVKILIRSEDERRAIGEYVASQLEQVGFSVTRILKGGAEFSAVLTGDPSAGEWDVCTVAWVSVVDVSNVDEDGKFAGFYGGSCIPHRACSPGTEFDAVIKRLAQRDYGSVEERRDLVARALDLSLKDSVRVWLSFRRS